LTVRVSVAVLLVVPLLPVIVTVRVPLEAFLLAVTVKVEVPAPVIDVGLKLADAPLPSPVAERAIEELKPPVTVVVIVTLPELLRETASVVGATLSEKPAVGEVTITVTVAA
jgi:hypothetical protein